MSLRGQIIRLAFEKEELREKLLPLVKKARILPTEVSDEIIGEAMRNRRFRDRNDAKSAVEVAFKEYAKRQMEKLQGFLRQHIRYWIKEVETAWETQKMYPR